MSKTIAYTVNDPDFFWSHRLSLAKSVIDKGFVVYLISDFKNSSSPFSSSKYSLIKDSKSKLHL